MSSDIVIRIPTAAMGIRIAAPVCGRVRNDGWESTHSPLSIVNYPLLWYDKEKLTEVIL